MSYPLATLLDLRADEQKSASAAVAQARQAHEEALVRLAAAQADERARQTRLTEERAKQEAAMAAGGRTAGDAQAGERLLAALRADLETASAHVSACARSADERAAALEQAREVLAAAVRDRETVERHREQWEAERKTAADRKAEDELDELAARRRDR